MTRPAVSIPVSIAAAMSACRRRCSWETASTLAARTANARDRSSVVTIARRHHSKACATSGSTGRAGRRRRQQRLQLGGRDRRRIAGLAALDEGDEQRGQLAVDEHVAVGDVPAHGRHGLAHRRDQVVAVEGVGRPHGAQRPQPAVDRVDVGAVLGRGVEDVLHDLRELLAADRLPGRVGRPHREPAPGAVGAADGALEAVAEVEVGLGDPQVAEDRVVDGDDGPDPGSVERLADHVRILAEGARAAVNRIPARALVAYGVCWLAVAGLIAVVIRLQVPDAAELLRDVAGRRAVWIGANALLIAMQVLLTVAGAVARPCGPAAQPGRGRRDARVCWRSPAGRSSPAACSTVCSAPTSPIRSPPARSTRRSCATPASSTPSATRAGSWASARWLPRRPCARRCGGAPDRSSRRLAWLGAAAVVVRSVAVRVVRRSRLRPLRGARDAAPGGVVRRGRRHDDGPTARHRRRGANRLITHPGGRAPQRGVPHGDRATPAHPSRRGVSGVWSDRREDRLQSGCSRRLRPGAHGQSRSRPPFGGRDERTAREW